MVLLCYPVQWWFEITLNWLIFGNIFALAERKVRNYTKISQFLFLFGLICECFSNYSNSVSRLMFNFFHYRFFARFLWLRWRWSLYINRSLCKFEDYAKISENLTILFKILLTFDQLNVLSNTTALANRKWPIYSNIFQKLTIFFKNLKKNWIFE